eukprot:scaffold201_cov405-Prasinococcus_capsulatus_cf.AAC.34
MEGQTPDAVALNVCCDGLGLRPNLRSMRRGLRQLRRRKRSRGPVYPIQLVRVRISQSTWGDDPTFVDIVAVARSDGAYNVLTKAALLELYGFYETVTTTVGPRTAEYDGVEYTYDHPDICFRQGPDSPCDLLSILSLWNYDRGTLSDDEDILATINTQPLLSPTGVRCRLLSLRSPVSGRGA